MRDWSRSNGLATMSLQFHWLGIAPNNVFRLGTLFLLFYCWTLFYMFCWRVCVCFLPLVDTIDAVFLGNYICSQGTSVHRMCVIERAHYPKSFVSVDLIMSITDGSITATEVLFSLVVHRVAVNINQKCCLSCQSLPVCLFSLTIRV